MNPQTFPVRASKRLRAAVLGLVTLHEDELVALRRRDTTRREEVRQSWEQHHRQVVAERGDHREATVGIACSGGGIRSAAFNLGALQGLQSRDRLRTADYLAAVSGGAYIAGAFSLVQQASATDQPPDFTREPPYALGSPEERHLRANSSYLAQGWRGRARLVCYLVFGSLLTLLVVATIVALVALPSAALGVAFDSGLHPGSDVPSLVHVLTPTLATSAALAGCSLLLARVLAALTAAGVPTVLVTVVRVLGKQLKGVQEKGRPRWLTRAPGWASWVAYAVTPLVIAAVFLLLYELATRLDLTGMFVAFGAALALLTLL